MCGISGNFSKNLINIDLNKNASLKQNHRGPDSFNYHSEKILNTNVYLAHNRLSIIDLSAISNQPFYSPCGNIKLIFNGEIYNYKDLKDTILKNEIFVTSSDTEVLLKLWLLYGEKLVNYIKGMFSFVITDSRLGVSYIYRDHFGIKPLFYYFKNDTFMFSSDIIYINTIEPQQENLNIVVNYLNSGVYDFSDETFFKNIHQLMPGHFIKFDHDKFTFDIHNYYLPTLYNFNDYSYDDIVKLLRGKLIDSVRSHLISDVEVGAALSGGLDSTALVCLMKKLAKNKNFKTFSYISEDKNSEEKWVDLVNNFIGAESHKIYSSEIDLNKDLNTLIRIQGEPFGSMSLLAQYNVFKSAKENGVKVTLDGQGADELFGGYNYFIVNLIYSAVINYDFRFIWNFLINKSKLTGFNKISCIKDFFVLVLKYKFNIFNNKKFYQDVFNPTSNKYLIDIYKKNLNNVSIFDVKSRLKFSRNIFGLRMLLRHGDRNSMANSVESRVPFVDREFVDIVSCIDYKFLFDQNGRSKSLLKDICSPFIPKEILTREDKIAFETPQKKILLENKELLFEALKLSKNIDFFNHDKLSSYIDDFINDKYVSSDDTAFVWRFLNYILWKKEFIG